MSEMINIPDGWEEIALNKLGTIITGSTPDTSNGTYYNGDYMFISPADLKNNKYITKSIKTLSKKGFDTTRNIPKNSLLITCIGELGKIGIATDNLATNQQLNSIICDENNNYEFIYYSFLQNKNKLNRLAGLQVVPLVNKTEFGTIEIQIPKSKKEQEKIAEILSEVDSAIDKAEAYYAKNQKIKTALKQDLLTHGIDEKGKIRNPKTHQYKDSSLGDIPMEFDVKNLKELGSCKNGLTYSPKDIREIDGILVLRSSNIIGNKLSFHDNVYVRKDMKVNYRVQEGDILICVRNGSRNLIGKNALITKEVEGMAHGAFMTVFNTDNYKYIFQLFQSDRFFNQVERNIGATINSINNSDLELFEFPIPKSKTEQQKIAQILSSQDEKIEKTKAKLEKLKSLKTALMQDLLSGTKRVNHLLGEEI